MQFFNQPNTKKWQKFWFWWPKMRNFLKSKTQKMKKKKGCSPPCTHLPGGGGQLLQDSREIGHKGEENGLDFFRKGPKVGEGRGQKPLSDSEKKPPKRVSQWMVIVWMWPINWKKLNGVIKPTLLHWKCTHQDCRVWVTDSVGGC